jgi:hypothetical protein
MRFSGGWMMCWADDVESLCAVLTGDPEGYLAGDETHRLVKRILTTSRLAAILQAELIHEAQTDGSNRWDRLTADEQALLLLPRHEAVRGPDLHEGLFAAPHWSAEVPLVVVTTQHQPWTEHPMPRGGRDRIIALDPLTPESLLDTLIDAGVVQVFLRSVDG